MNIKKLGLDKKQATIILGAGASYGASCFENKRVSAPLDADFFRCVQSLDYLRKDNNIQNLLKFIRSEFDPNLRMPMEKFFTQIEALDHFYTTAKIHRGPAVQRYAYNLEKYTATLAAIFDRLKREVGPLRCDYHEMLVELLHHGNANYGHDVILSFNYDCLIDEALKEKAAKRWDAAKGYGYDVKSGSDYWHKHNATGPQATHSIQLLKLHGSLNWKRETLAHGKPSKILNLSRNDAVERIFWVYFCAHA
jgi:hypothetical protein